jgi:hypothetical protein
MSAEYRKSRSSKAKIDVRRGLKNSTCCAIMMPLSGFTNRERTEIALRAGLTFADDRLK